MVTGKTVYNEVRPTTDGNYVKKDKTTGENLSALDSKIGKLDANGNYIKKDDSVSQNLSTLDTQVKTNADAIKKNSEDITNINKSISSLDQNTVKYDDSNKSKVTLAGKDGTTITNVKDGTLSDSSTDAVNGKQLYNEQQAREAADKAISNNVTNNTNEITKIKNGDFTEASKTAIHNIAKDAVEVVDGVNTTVTKTEGTDTTPTKYAVNVEGKGKVASGDMGLISGDTLYKEVHVDKDGSYVKGSNTVGQNLSALDAGLKTTSDLIHTNDKGDTIQIGGNSTATKIDVSGKDANGNTTGRVITGVVSDANDPNSAANVGYVNGLTAANTQQIYRDMNNAYSRLDTNINRAAAGSNALAALHPLDFDPADKASFAVGYGHYHNANAAAVGAFYQPNANTMVNMGISLGNGDPGFNAGVSFKIGKGSAYNGVSKAEMAQTIHDQAAEISTIKANDAAKDKRIDALEKENQEMKKQIQEILARLNG
ncbi:MAG: YadA-like family protein [Megasphaera sp.]|uniref:YadA C-terminal domain-containing protein n=1 Tax=Megasphaera sp. TaxID=2023260 RepID=UPI003F0AF075